MPAKTDLRHTLDGASGRVTEADQMLHGALAGQLPTPHRRLLSGARTDLDRAQQKLFQARNDPWGLRPPEPSQMELV